MNIKQKRQSIAYFKEIVIIWITHTNDFTKFIVYFNLILCHSMQHFTELSSTETLAALNNEVGILIMQFKITIMAVQEFHSFERKFLYFWQKNSSNFISYVPFTFTTRMIGIVVPSESDTIRKERNCNGIYQEL